MADAENLYGYTPSKATCIVFTLLFALSTVLHVGQAIRSRLWWLFPSAILCGIMEIIGWAARWYSVSDPTKSGPFIVQASLTVIAPTPLVATNFIILGRLIGMLGAQYSRLEAKYYTIIFLGGDIFSFLVQGTGGGLASSASNDGKSPETGENITLAGVILQLGTYRLFSLLSFFTYMLFLIVMISLYIILAIEFFVRFNKDRPVRAVPVTITNGVPQPIRGFLSTRLFLISVAIGFNTICLLIRAIYRCIEFADGWDGKVRKTEVYFNVLDGAMIIIAMYVLNIAHPGILLYPSKPETDEGNYRLQRRKHESGEGYPLNNYSRT